MQRALRCLACTLAISLLPAPTKAAFTDLVSLGSGTFTIDPEFSIGSITQDISGTTFKPAVSLGDTVSGTLGPLDWSSAAQLTGTIYLKMAITGTNPGLAMTLYLYNSDFSQWNTYQGATTEIDESPGYFKFDLVGTSTPAVLADVAGAQITWDGNGDINATIQSIATEADSSFTARAPGGVRFLTSATGIGVQLLPDTTAWSALSDRNAKTDITTIDHSKILRKVAALPVTSWRYKHSSRGKFLGPMAQDFHAAFGLGHDNKHISTLDTDGVTLSALKGLIAELQDRKARSAAQEKRLTELEAELQTLSEKLRGNLPPAE